MDIEVVLARCHAAGRSVPSGQGTLSYIPALTAQDRNLLGIAVADVDGAVRGVGDDATSFSVQSITKPFALALALAADEDYVWRRVGHESSGSRFDALLHLEHGGGRPPNPFINAGALVVTDILITLYGDARVAVRELLRTESGNSGIDFDPLVARSELASSHRNAAVAHYMASFGMLTNSVEEVLEHYVWQCALAASCRDVARAGLFFAAEGAGVCGQVVPERVARRINALMLTCGLYDGVGDFTFRVGFSAKSGVGGGVLAVIPSRGTVCAWSPPLDTSGNSVAAVAALERFSELTGWSTLHPTKRHNS